MLADYSPKLVIGTARFSRGYGTFGKKADSKALSLMLSELSKEVYRGIQLDTAAAYGSAEEEIGEARLTRVRVHTKISRKKGLREGAVQSLRKLNKKMVTTIYLHESDSVKLPESFFRSAHNLVDSGICQYLGVSVYSRDELFAAVRNPFVKVIQMPKNIFDKRISNEDIRKAKSAGKKIFIRGIFLQGVLMTKSNNLHPIFSSLRQGAEILESEASFLGVSVSDLLITHAFQTYPVDGIVLGVDRVEHLEAAEAAMNRTLSPATLSRLSEIKSVDPLALDPRNWPRLIDSLNG